jgi:hypothetical protein
VAKSTADIPCRLLLAADLAELLTPVQEAVDDVESLRSAVLARLS